MKFSIVIPLYNGAKFIETTLDAVLAQTYKNYEIIMVNDGSPDNVGEIIKKYIANHSGIEFTYIEQKNMGLGGARNTALKHASGEIIAILDQDDIWYPNKLEKVARIYKENPDVHLVCHDQYIRSGGKIMGVNRTGPGAEDMFRQLLFCGNTISTSATTFKKAVIDAIGCFSEGFKTLHLCEDYDLWLRMVLAGYKFHFLPEILGEYVRHDKNYATINCVPMLIGDLYVLDLYYSKLKQKRISDWIKYRKKKAGLNLRIAYYVFRSSGSVFNGFPYLIKALLNDPPLIFTLTKHLMKKTLKKGEIR